MPEPCETHNLNIHGHHYHAEKFGQLEVYGSDAPLVEKVIGERDSFGDYLPGSDNIRAGQVVWAVRNEMARTVEDFLSRRTRMLILDARSSIEAAPVVADLMAQELGRDDAWASEQVAHYTELAKGYLAI